MSNGGDERLAILASVYQGLMARYNSNTSVRWQILALGLTAQGFVIGAASQVGNRTTTAVMLSLVIIFIGVATVISGHRLELLAAVDRFMLDVYESRLLTGDDTDLQLLHSSPTRSRAHVSLRGEILEEYLRSRGAKSKIFRVLGPASWWAVSELVISTTGAAVPILGLIGQ